MVSLTFGIINFAGQEIFVIFAFNLLFKPMTEKLFTKSAFKVSLDCPWKLYYYRNPNLYFNANAENDFLESLAQGGFQVGELAKIYSHVDEDLKDIMDYDGSVRRTNELMKRENVCIAEAAFRWGNMFVRVDILKKVGNHISLIEVKAKSWDDTKDKFCSEKTRVVSSGVRSYVYDVAFQKYVVEGALKEQYSDQCFKVEAFLMMADKTKRADINGLNKLFKIEKDKNGRSKVVTAPDVVEVLNQGKPENHVITAFPVDGVCNAIIAGETGEQGKDDWMLNLKFTEYVQLMADKYCSNSRLSSAPLLSKTCFDCEYRKAKGQEDNLLDGWRECWLKHTTNSNLEKLSPIASLNGFGLNRDKWIKNGRYFMDELTYDDIKEYDPRKAGESGLDLYERKWLQISLETGNEELLERFKDKIVSPGVYLDVEGLKEEMATWKYPLHMIDFETTAVALPFYEGMKPYEQVAFQFSHHIIREDGSIEHAGQYLNEDVNEFPNFEFVRRLKVQLEQDKGSVFRYANHENSILNCIAEQLESSKEKDKDELIEFIRTITHHKDNGVTYAGERDMIDLLELVKRFFYNVDEMHGRNSIKQVLPAVLNSSEYLKEKYAKPIYGSVIKSQNIPADKPIAWIHMDEQDHVESPYHLLDNIGNLLGVTEEEMKQMEMNDSDADFQVANGGAALTAYNKLLFCSDEENASTGAITEKSTVPSFSEALRTALLRYCELDTMSMVFIWEYFKDNIK